MRYVTLLSIVACLLGPNTSSAEPPKAVSRDRTAERLSALERQVRQLQTKVWLLENGEKSVELNPTNLPSGFQRIQTNNGALLVSLENVEPYLDGVRVTLHIGNPLSAGFAGFTIEAQWGAKPPAGEDAAWAKWSDSLLKRSLSFTDSLDAGAWNPVTFVLSPAPVQTFGYLSVSISTNTVTLRQAGR